MNYFLTEIVPALIGGAIAALFIAGLILLRNR